MTNLSILGVGSVSSRMSRIRRRWLQMANQCLREVPPRGHRLTSLTSTLIDIHRHSHSSPSTSTNLNQSSTGKPKGSIQIYINNKKKGGSNVFQRGHLSAGDLGYLSRRYRLHRDVGLGRLRLAIADAWPMQS